jgi:hypothetical protein
MQTSMQKKMLQPTLDEQSNAAAGAISIYHPGVENPASTWRRREPIEQARLS